MTARPTVAALIATKHRHELLRDRALPSVARQGLLPSFIVVVNDGAEWTSEQIGELRRAVGSCELQLAANRRSPGAAGAWNTGLGVIATMVPSHTFVAMLDDDDEWDAEHLEANVEAAEGSDANIVVSGLRLVSEAGEIKRSLVRRLRDRDFLVGNEGWQGSNTFVTMDLMRGVGGFRETLPCMHDRDLAVRMLRHPEARPVLVPRWTSTWYIDRGGRLSERRGELKLVGLRNFWRLYASELSVEERRAYLDRAERLFGFGEAEVTSGVQVLELGVDRGVGDWNG